MTPPSDMLPSCRATLMETWEGLLRVRRRVLVAVEADLREQGLPALNECLALIQLREAANQAMRPSDLERVLEAPQYTVSRLIDRLEKAGFVARKACPVDGRSHYAALTAAGAAEIVRIWPVYCASIEKHLGANLCDVGAAALAGMLKRVAPEHAA